MCCIIKCDQPCKDPYIINEKEKKRNEQLEKVSKKLSRGHDQIKTPCSHLTGNPCLLCTYVHDQTAGTVAMIPNRMLHAAIQICHGLSYDFHFTSCLHRNRNHAGRLNSLDIRVLFIAYMCFSYKPGQKNKNNTNH